MSNKTNLILDLIIFIVLLVVASPFTTGYTIHEWLAVSFLVTIVIHLLFHWDWIVKIGGSFVKKLFHQSRLNFIVDMLFFITMTGSLFSGLMISREFMPTLGIQLQADRSWEMIHKTIANLTVIMLGLHFALHLKWVWTNIKRYLINPVSNLFHQYTQKPLAAQSVDGKKEQ